MTITYEIEDSLYINITNKCTNACVFCIREGRDGLGDSDSLWLEREPEKEEILADIFSRDLKKYKELVFCGYGEPCMRFYNMVWVANEVKAKINIPIRLNTNGHANLIEGRDVTPELKGAIDTVSISLNAQNAEEYNKICKCEYGDEGYYAMLDFTKKVKTHVKNVIMSVVDTNDEECKARIKECETIAKSLNVEFRVRVFS